MLFSDGVLEGFALKFWRGAVASCVLDPHALHNRSQSGQYRLHVSVVFLVSSDPSRVSNVKTVAGTVAGAVAKSVSSCFVSFSCAVFVLCLGIVLSYSRRARCRLA